MRIKYAMRAVMLKRTETGNLLVAGGAGDQSISGKLGIIKQPAPQFNAFLTQRIIRKCINRSRKTVGYFQFPFFQPPDRLLFFAGSGYGGESGYKEDQG